MASFSLSEQMHFEFVRKIPIRSELAAKRQWQNARNWRRPRQAGANAPHNGRQDTLILLLPGCRGALQAVVLSNPRHGECRRVLNCPRQSATFEKLPHSSRS